MPYNVFKPQLAVTIALFLFSYQRVNSIGFTVCGYHTLKDTYLQLRTRFMDTKNFFFWQGVFDQLLIIGWLCEEKKDEFFSITDRRLVTSRKHEIMDHIAYLRSNSANTMKLLLKTIEDPYLSLRMKCALFVKKWIPVLEDPYLLLRMKCALFVKKWIPVLKGCFELCFKLDEIGLEVMEKLIKFVTVYHGRPLK